ncbi:hypothetical protein [Kitasatospora sp. NPDC001132]
MHFASEQRLDDDVLEREFTLDFTLGEIPGTLWTSPDSTSAPAPLILLAHNNGLPRREPRLVARARYCAAQGYAAVPIAAAGFLAGGYVPHAQREAARKVTVPLLFLLQWDEEGNPRQRALDLFDTFGSQQKTLHANLGGHVGTPWFEMEDGGRFYDRHLR